MLIGVGLADRLDALVSGDLVSGRGQDPVLGPPRASWGHEWVVAGHRRKGTDVPRWVSRPSGEFVDRGRQPSSSQRRRLGRRSVEHRVAPELVGSCSTSGKPPVDYRCLFRPGAPRDRRLWREQVESVGDTRPDMKLDGHAASPK